MCSVSDVRLAIHTKNAGGFSHRWVEACRQRGIRHEIVDCYGTDAVDVLRAFDGLLWHFHHLHATDLLIARHVLTAAEYMGLCVFPDLPTAYFFDDKIAQKYVFEALNVPIPATYVFYDRASAVDWLARATYPLVWKLRRGAGSQNVRLVADAGAARAMCEQAFSAGSNPVPRYFTDTGMRIKRVGGLADFWDKLRRLPRAYFARKAQRKLAIRESGYVMFQQFIPDNKTDTRITVIGRRAFGFQRDVRKDDFRASGSGSVRYDPAGIDPACLTMSFEVAAAMGTQSVALDFVKDQAGKPYLVEISYGYEPDAVRKTGGYWDRDLQWHEGDYRPEDLILDDLLASIEQRRKHEAPRRSAGVESFRGTGCSDPKA